MNSRLTRLEGRVMALEGLGAAPESDNGAIWANILEKADKAARGEYGEPVDVGPMLAAHRAKLLQAIRKAQDES